LVGATHDLGAGGIGEARELVQMLVDLRDLLRALARGADEKRPFDGRLDVDKLANTNNISG
jgi:hypothetical protein